MPHLRNVKHEAFAQKYVRSLVQAQAPPSATRVYSEVYHCQPDSARASAARLLGDVSVRERVYELIAAHNRPEELAADLDKLRHAKRGVYFKGKKVAEEADHAARIQAVALCLKAQEGLKPAEQVAVDARSVNFRFEPTDENLARMEKVIQDLGRLNRFLGLPERT